MQLNNETKKIISDATGIPYSSIQDYENGRCSAKMGNILLIAKHFNIPPRLLTEDHETYNSMNFMMDSQDRDSLLMINDILSKLTKEDKDYLINIITKFYEVNNKDRKLMSEFADIVNKRQ